MIRETHSTFKHKSKTYLVVEDKYNEIGCQGCASCVDDECTIPLEVRGHCIGALRKGWQSVIFEEVKEIKHEQ